MSKILIRSADREFAVADMAELMELVRQGKLGRAAKVRLAKAKAWVRIDSLSEVSTFFNRDVWAAWDGDTDEDLLSAFAQPSSKGRLSDQDTMIDTYVRMEVEELPVSALTPVDEVPAAPMEPDPPESEEVTPQETTHPRDRPSEAGPRRPTGKVIAFPNPEIPMTQGAHALDVLTRPVSASSSGSAPPKNGVRWGRITMIGAVGAMCMLVWVWYVNTNATTNFVARTAVDVTKTLPPILTAEQVAKEVAISPYEALEDDLREQLKEGILDIPGDTEFEDALMIELRRVRLNVGFVRVQIGSWAGRKKDLPDNVAFQIKLNTKEGDLDRDLGALGLVMGKYIQHYGINATELNVLIESGDGIRKVRMNPEVARRFFTHRESLEDFLTTAFVVND
jgi:hypothetical protein